MLEFQIKEKERLRQEDKSLREKIYPQSNILKDQIQIQAELEKAKVLELEQLR